MNTFLKTIALVLAAAIPVAISADATGLSLPAYLGTGVLFCAFVVTLTLMTVLADYRDTKPLEAPVSAPRPTTSSRLPLAA